MALGGNASATCGVIATVNRRGGGCGLAHVVRGGCGGGCTIIVAGINKSMRFDGAALKLAAGIGGFDIGAFVRCLGGGCGGGFGFCFL